MGTLWGSWSCRQVMFAKKTFSLNQSKILSQKKVVPSCVWLLGKYLTHSCDLWLSVRTKCTPTNFPGLVIFKKGDYHLD